MAASCLTEQSILLEGLPLCFWAHAIALEAIRREWRSEAPAISGLPLDALLVLLWYGDVDAHEAAAQALSLPAGSIAFVEAVREPLTKSQSLHNYWGINGGSDALKLLDDLAFQRAPHLNQLCDRLISRQSTPWHHAVSEVLYPSVTYLASRLMLYSNQA